MPATGHRWRDWNREEWNKALFLHFFRDSDGEDSPVHRIQMTPSELIKVVSDSGADPHEIQEAFLGTIRTSSHIDFNHRLSRYPIDPEKGWKGIEIPPYFIELAFSCLVASPPDGKILNEGDFRNRLAMLLDHDESVANYPLDRLASLWRAFSKWLNIRRAAGEPYRRLVLPHSDHRVRIGYSINLAFPSLKDQKTLTKVLSKGGIEDAPPIPAVFELIGNAIDKFSIGFRKAYEEFRKAYRSREKNLETYPFWGAVIETVARIESAETEKTADERRLKLVIERDGVLLLLSTVPGSVMKNGVAFVEADTPYGEFRNILCEGPLTSVGFYGAARKLLQGRLRSVLNGRGWQAINIALDQGLLLFKKTESQSWELVFSRKEEGDYQGLIKDYLEDAFLWALPQGRRPYGTPSQYRGWTQLDLFPGEWLGSLTFTEDSPLAQIRCLQPTVSGPRLSLVGGCMVDGGYLGIPACLPSVRAPLSDAVQVVPIVGQERIEPIRLTRAERDSSDFSFPGCLKNPLEGAHRVIGSLGGKVLLQKEVVFRPEIVVNAYARPSDPSAWEIEAGGPDVVTYGMEPGSTHCPTDGNERKAFGRTIDISKPSSATPPLPHRKLSPSNWPRVKAWTSQMRENEREPTKSLGAEHFMEVCGGLAMRRKGISEVDLLHFLGDCLSIDRYDQQWDVVRAWMEGGYLDRLHYKKWRRTEYFPCTPRFVLEDRAGQVQGVLTGLATPTFRNRADVELLELGAERVQVVSRSDWIVPAPVWRAPSVDPFFRVSKTLGIEEPVWTRPLFETLWSLTDVLSAREAPPKYYERWSCWDWTRGCFSRSNEPTEEGVEVIRFQRLDRPPYYQVTIDGEHAWWSTSRNWALLLAHEFKCEPVFALAGSNQVARISKGQVYLPLPVGRYLSATGATAPGPVEDGEGGYIYQFRDSKERQVLLSAIWGSVGGNTIEMGRWALWILALARRFALEPGVLVAPLPNPIRKRLERFQEVPEFRELSRAKIHPSLLPRIKEGLSRFKKSKGI